MDDGHERSGCMWLVAVYFVLAAVVGIASLYFIHSGIFESLPGISPEERAYFANLGTLDYVIPLAVIACNLVGVVYLFRFRKAALWFFIAAFVIGLCQTVWHIAARNYLNVMNGFGWIGFAVGTALILTILFYVASLVRKGVLR